MYMYVYVCILPGRRARQRPERKSCRLKKEVLIVFAWWTCASACVPACKLKALHEQQHFFGAVWFCAVNFWCHGRSGAAVEEPTRVVEESVEGGQSFFAQRGRVF